MTQALNSLGTTIAPIFGSMLILSTVVKSPAELKQLSPQRRRGLPPGRGELGADAVPGAGGGARRAGDRDRALQAAQDRRRVGRRDAVHRRLRPHKSAWSYRHLVLGAVGIFVYVGAEVAIGSFLVNYFKEPEIGGLTEAQGAHYVAYYWGGAMIGRFIGTFTLRVVKPGKLLAIHALGAARAGAGHDARHRPGRDVVGASRSGSSTRSCSRRSSPSRSTASASTPARARGSCAWRSSAAR